MATIHNSKSTLAISGLHDIEESIWSPKWGMKGKVDASVDATILDMNPKPTTGAPVPRVSEMPHPMPFEIKTGRSVGVLEHRAQTMLYTFLMEERYSKCEIPQMCLPIRTDWIFSYCRNTGPSRPTLLYPD